MTNFTKYGHPNGEGVPEWPAFNNANPVVMYLGPTAYLGPVPDENSLWALDRYFEWRRSDEGKAWAE
jgi:para-nitrobenzyl esterase